MLIYLLPVQSLSDTRRAGENSFFFWNLKKMFLRTFVCLALSFENFVKTYLFCMILSVQKFWVIFYLSYFIFKFSVSFFLLDFCMFDFYQ